MAPFFAPPCICSRLREFTEHFAAISTSHIAYTCCKTVTHCICNCEGWYGVPEGMMFYMPVIYTSPGHYQVVDDLPLTSSVRRKIRAIVKVYTRISSEHITHVSLIYGQGVLLAISRSRVRLPAIPLLCSLDSGQVVHTHVPLSPSSIIWYGPKFGRQTAVMLYGREGDRIESHYSHTHHGLISILTCSILTL